jgi:signal transduction histidine kinase
MTTYPGPVLQRAYGWMRGHPRGADRVLAGVLLAVSVSQIIASYGPDQHFPVRTVIVEAAVNLLLAGTIVRRRSETVPAFAVAVTLVAAQVFLGLHPSNANPPVRALEPSAIDVVVVILLYTLAAYRPRRTSLTGLAVCLAGAAIAIARYAPLHTSNNGDWLLLIAVAVGATLLSAWVLGDAAAYRRAYYVSLEQRLAAAERARDLQDKRTRAVDESAARLRGIERDLHDGAQVRLAALAMSLGEIKESLASGELKDLAEAAHQNAKDTLTELRDLARGIHPPVLDRGIGPALAILAETSAIPATLTVTIEERPSPAIEAIAYFCTAELLANAAKHSAAKQVAITIGDGPNGIEIAVTDDGAGGATITPTGGLAGLRERVQTVDGRLDVHSPPGGPTVTTIELPRHA